ncbi:MAG: amino acid permease [Thermoguttaceae bacterium]
MSWKHLFARKDFEMLLAEMAGEHRLRRVLGPVSLTSLGVGCIIGAGIFVLTGVAAADYGGPAIILSFAVAAVGCALAALCYAEFAAMAPVAGSVYAYAYTTLGEIFAWIVGWDLILEYSMGTAAVASSWSAYLNELIVSIGRLFTSHPWEIPKQLLNDPFSHVEGLAGRAWLNLPSVLVMVLVTIILVRGIRESARTNAMLVFVKVAVVLFVIAIGIGYVEPTNWTDIPVEQRVLPQERIALDLAKKELARRNGGDPSPEQVSAVAGELTARCRVVWLNGELKRLQASGRMSSQDATARLARSQQNSLPRSLANSDDAAVVETLLPEVQKQGEAKELESWGLLGWLGLNHWLRPIDDATRSPFMPYGLSGIMLGASIVFFAYIGFDSISTHAEEAHRPQRDVPIGIITSLVFCTVLYMAVAAVITGMVPYPKIDVHAPIAVAFGQRAEETHSGVLHAATVLISAGGLAGMTSVLLVLFLSQARVFMAMARDGLLPRVFGEIHPRFRTPHIATMATGGVICLVAALTPIQEIAKMVNIGTLLAFVMVCAAVMVLRVQRPNVARPFRCPALWIVGPLGILVNVVLMLFLPPITWARLGIWLVLGLAIYFLYSHRRSHLIKHLLHEIQEPRDETLDDQNDVACRTSV